MLCLRVEFAQKIFKARGFFEQSGDLFLEMRIFDALNNEISFHPILGFGFASKHQVSTKCFRILHNVAPIEWGNLHFQSVTGILLIVIQRFQFVQTSTHFVKCCKGR